MSEMAVTQLWRYPVKSMQGESVERLVVSELGAEGDRAWGVLDVAAGKVLTGKRTGALLEASARWDGGAVVLSLPGGGELEAGSAAADAALSAWLGREVRLVGPADPRPYELLMDPVDDTSEVWDFATPPASLVDLAAVHVLTTASLRAVAAAGPGSDWSVHRFRPTAVVDAPGDTWVEDDWVGGEVRLGPVALAPFMRTPRCSLPHRSQPPNGIDRDPAVSRVLHDVHGNDLGIYCGVTTPGPVSVGDAVTVTPPA